MFETAAPILDHLDRLTDSTGLIQHAIYCVPRRESGYTTDDNARALRLCARLWRHSPDERMLSRVSLYMSFLEHARRPLRGFHNMLSYQRDWLDFTGTGDSQGQAILGLAEVLAGPLPDGYRALARELIDSMLPALAELRSLRAQAYVIQAWVHLWQHGVECTGALETLARLSADRLVECFHRSRRNDWPWFESCMTYANAVLPHALFDAAGRWPQEEYLSVAEASFGFLAQVTTLNDLFSPIGNLDWYPRDEARAMFDQQPVEASTMAMAAWSAFEATHDIRYRAIFERARNWFHGGNMLALPLVAERGGGCYDGLQASGVNRNQGAESTLAYLWTEFHYRTIQPAPAVLAERLDIGS